MTAVWPYIAVFFIGALGGYILKDKTTIEYKSEVVLNRPKVKGRGNKMDLDQVTEVHMKPMTRKERREARRAKKQTE
jgi:hypothetical protein